jgi:hypothetical protein
MTDAIFKTFKALVPNTIADAQLDSCSIPEPDPARVMYDGTTGEGAAWVFNTTYTANTRVVLGAPHHRVYFTATAGLSQITPNIDTTRWTDEGPTNRWAWADSQVATPSTSLAPIVVTARPGSITHVGLAGLVNVASVQVEMWSTPGGALVHDRTYTTNDTSSSTPLWDLYFRAPTYAGLKVISGLPVYPGCQVRVTLTGYEYPISAGLIALGRTLTLGVAEVQASVTYRDYGYRKTDQWGNTTRKPGAKAKDLKCTAVYPMSEANNVDRSLLQLLDTGAIVIPSEQTRFSWLVSWGTFNPTESRAENSEFVRTDFDFEGLI